MDILKTIVETFFRLFGFPTKTGLRLFGNPGPNAPVFVTGNFDLTVRRVSKHLKGLDCYLLVAPTRGINVWCAAAGGFFNAHSVISVVKTSRIGEKVRHRTLILPQLSAPGVDIEWVKRETGWHCKFGPVYARDIPEYVKNRFRKTEEMSRARFPLSDRLEMAAMWAASGSIVVGIILLVFNRGALPGALALIWGLAVAFFAFFEPLLRYLPGKTGLHKTLFLGLLVAVGLTLYGLFVGGWGLKGTIGWSVGTLLVAAMLGFDLEGQSPLYAGSTITYWGERWPWVLDIWGRLGFQMEPSFTVHVDAALCTGDGMCTQVCPKGVYALYQVEGSKRKKSRVVNLDACEQCTACVKQCPSGAIWTEPPIKTFEPAEVLA
ncbi:MAG: HgcAB-like fusion protein [Anaerolineae bacterium]